MTNLRKYQNRDPLIAGANGPQGGSGPIKREIVGVRIDTKFCILKKILLYLLKYFSNLLIYNSVISNELCTMILRFIYEYDKESLPKDIKK